MTRSMRSPVSMEDFTALLAQSSLGERDPSTDHVAINTSDVARVIGTSTIMPTGREATQLAARRAAQQVRRQASQLLDWVHRLAATLEADGQLFVFAENHDPVAAMEQLHSDARPGDVLLLCGINTRAAECLEILRAAREAELGTLAVVPSPARGVRAMTDDLIEIAGTAEVVKTAHQTVLRTFKTLLDASPRLLGTNSAAELPPRHLSPVTDAAHEPDDPPITSVLAAALSPAASGQPFRPTLTHAAIDRARAKHQRTVIPPRPAPNNTYDLLSVLAAVRAVDGVQDASTRATPSGAHSLRLDLAEGADPAEVSRRVARLLQEQMGLDASVTEDDAPPPAPAMPSPPQDSWPQRVEPRWWEANPNDTGWRAAREAAGPPTAAETSAGLPKRVPQANLVPGSPLQEERPLRTVRDAAVVAARSSGYFRGSRRGQEIGGYALGDGSISEAAGGRHFPRDSSTDDAEHGTAVDSA